MLRMDQFIDLLVPRGGAGLVRFVAENATMPAVTGYLRLVPPPLRLMLFNTNHSRGRPTKGSGKPESPGKQHRRQH